MGESYIVRKGGGGKLTAAPTITIVTEAPDGVTFTLTNNDDNTALISYEVDGNIGGVELAAAATSSNITVALTGGTYTLSAFATVVGEVATSATASVTIVLPTYTLLYSETVATAKTQIDITGLSIGKDDGLRLVYTFVGNNTTTTEYRCFPNDLTTNTNYYHQLLGGSGTSIFAGRVNSNLFALGRSNRKSAGFADIKVSNNDRFVAQSQMLWFAGAEAAGVDNENFNNVGTQTVSSITKLSIVASQTSGIAVGSKIALYKVTEAA